MEGSKARLLSRLMHVPAGSVISYGDLGKELGLTARHVAYFLSRLNALESESYPWHRVVGAGGKIGQFANRDEQIARLRSEGVEVDGGKILASSLG